MQIHQSLDCSRKYDGSGLCSSARMRYVVSEAGSGDCSAAAVQLVRNTAPLSIDRARRKSVEVIDVPGGGIYKIEARYEVPEESDGRAAGDRRWSFDVNTRTSRIYRGLELVRKVSVAGETLPEPGVLIGWNGVSGGGSEVTGTEILQPELHESCIATFRAGAITGSYKRKIAEMVGKVNAQSFHGWNRGEVLLYGISQHPEYETQSGDKLIDVLFRFAIRPNESRVCGGVTVTDCGGWNCLWCITRSDVQNNRNVTVGVYESRIYAEASFSALQL